MNRGHSRCTRLLLTFILFELVIFPSWSQVIKGRITDQSGKAIQYATVYISELRQGTTANIKGDYELKLEPGNYEVSYQSLGYQQVVLNINIQSGTITKDVVLPLQYYQIPEVRISATGEDPAYIIMRKVIGMAPYYLNYVKHYKAEVYLKGNLVIKKIPKIIQNRMKVEDPTGKDIKLKPGDSFFMESYNEMEFTAPDKYFQKVLSINSTFPDGGNSISPMEFIQASFYQPEIADMAISPLSPAAFSHYKFRYTGMSTQGKYTINKIQVIPKRKSQQLFEGTIYIIEDLWCLYSVDLVNENLAGKIRIRQLYIPVQDEVWMPVSHNFEMNVEFMGILADASYGSAMKYLEVTRDPDLKRPETITTNFGGKNMEPDTVPQTKTEKEISKILKKDELTNRDMVKLSKLMEKKAKKEDNDTAKKTLEVTDNTVQEIDRKTVKKDSAYWSAIRPIPLSDTEKKSLKVSDSLKAQRNILKPAVIDSVKISEEKTKVKKGNNLTGILRSTALGRIWSDSTGKSFRFGGLLNLKNFGFNSVDGFMYGIDFRLNKFYKGKRQISISPQFKWAFSRQRPNWTIDSYYKFNWLKQSQIYLKTGQSSVDFNNETGINLFMNMSFSLLLKKNYLRLYESGYLTAGYKTDIANGLNLDISGTYENRKLLQNTTNFSIFKPALPYSENLPTNNYLLPGAYPLYALRNMQHGDLAAKLTWTPRQRYRISYGQKYPAGSDWPTFKFTWLHGINEFREMQQPLKHFDMLRLEATRREDLGAFSEMKWLVRGGGFLNKEHTTFYDFYHVNTQNLPLHLNSYNDVFMLPSYYSMSTPEFFVQGHFKYTTPYLFLKYLPIVSNTLVRENISIGYMGSRFHRNYWEAGYSISEIFLLAEAGIYVGFEDLKFKSWGFVLTLKFD